MDVCNLCRFFLNHYHCILNCILCELVSKSEDTALVMDCMGRDLKMIFKKCKRIFSLKTILVIAIQLITIVEAVHMRKLLLRDVKPGNIVIERGSKADQLYLIDFGLSEYYRNPNTGKHIRQEEDLLLQCQPLHGHNATTLRVSPTSFSTSSAMATFPGNRKSVARGRRPAC